MDYLDDPDQLPALPDPGPRDGRHGVDRDEEYDPYPPKDSHSPTEPLRVSADDAKWHLGVLLARAESGEEIVVTRNGRPIARIVPPRRRASVSRRPVVAAVPARQVAEKRTPELLLTEVAVDELTVDEFVVDELVIEELIIADGGEIEFRALILDDLEQLPELPDPGPRDGRHGVDRESGVGQPARRMSRREARRTASGH